MSATEGNCYICSITLGKIAMKNHLIKEHVQMKELQSCFLLKIEGEYNKDYWLYVEVPKNSDLCDLDDFLRKIWLECCNHMSIFTRVRFKEIDMNSMFSNFSVGDKLFHEYDMGTGTKTIITVVRETTRKKQKEAVRLLARNVLPEINCQQCKKPAEYIDIPERYGEDARFYCEDCVAKLKRGFEGMFSVVNSPRMGVCGYDGERDVYTFNKIAILEKYNK